MTIWIRTKTGNDRVRNKRSRDPSIKDPGVKIECMIRKQTVYVRNLWGYDEKFRQVRSDTLYLKTLSLHLLWTYLEARTKEQIIVQ